MWVPWKIESASGWKLQSTASKMSNFLFSVSIFLPKQIVELYSLRPHGFHHVFQRNWKFFVASSSFIAFHVNNLSSQCNFLIKPILWLLHFGFISRNSGLLLICKKMIAFFYDDCFLSRQVLEAVGFNVTVLVGGYRAYRSWVRQELDRLPKLFQFRVITGYTGETNFYFPRVFSWKRRGNFSNKNFWKEDGQSKRMVTGLEFLLSLWLTTTQSMLLLVSFSMLLLKASEDYLLLLLDKSHQIFQCNIQLIEITFLGNFKSFANARFSKLLLYFELYCSHVSDTIMHYVHHWIVKAEWGFDRRTMRFCEL